jgi:hypothetical protein
MLEITLNVPQTCGTYRVPKKKPGIMEFCIFGIQKGGYTLKVTITNTYLIKSTQLAIIQIIQLPER